MSLTRVPASTIAVMSRSHSSSEPSHHATRSGLVSAAISRTHATSFACLVGASSSPGIVGAEVMLMGSTRATGGDCENYNKQLHPRLSHVLRSRWALFAHSLDLFHRRAQRTQPVVAVLADQPHAPRESVRPRTGHAGVHEGVQDPSLGLAQPRHHRHGHGREQRGLPTALRTPGHLAVEALLGLAGDRHPALAGVLAEPRDPPGCRILVTDRLRRRQRSHDEDLVAVHGDLWRGGEPLLGQPATEPTGYVFGTWAFAHYMITQQSIPDGNCLDPGGKLGRIADRGVADEPLTDVRRPRGSVGQQR